MSLFRESLSQSFFPIFALYALMISYLIYSFYRLKKYQDVDDFLGPQTDFSTLVKVPDFNFCLDILHKVYRESG